MSQDLFNQLNLINSLFKQNLLWFFSNISILANIWTLLDILIVSIIFYYLFIFFKGSKAFNILVGLIILALFAIVSQVFNLVALSWLLRSSLTILIVAIPIVFQPELRNALEHLGRNPLIRTQLLFSPSDYTKNVSLVAAITQACLNLAKKKHGALLVFERETGLADFIKTGVWLDAHLSTPLIEAIFNPSSPLHDGAVIIQYDRLKAASCTLPVTEKKMPELGLRHKAALGISEQTDALVILISEEKGTLYKVSSRKISEPLNEERLMRILHNLYPDTAIESPRDALKNLIKNLFRYPKKRT